MSDSIIRRIDTDLASVSGVRCGMSAYANALNKFNVGHRTRGAKARMIEDIVDLACATYRRGVAQKVELLTFSDGAFQCVFDYTLSRTVMMYGKSKATAPGTRDSSYHRGYPGMPPGFDKGHAMSHAQGGVDGGPNYFPQARALNQGRSDAGRLWRAIETYLAANAGLFAFVRLIYLAKDPGFMPTEVEYGLLDDLSQFRSVIFANQ